MRFEDALVPGFSRRQLSSRMGYLASSLGTVRPGCPRKHEKFWKMKRSAHTRLYPYAVVCGTEQTAGRDGLPSNVIGLRALLLH